MNAETPRWFYRFTNYTRAVGLLQEAADILQTRGLSQLEKEGAIRRFGYTWELAWKVMHDYLEASGVILTMVTPAAVIRAAYAARLVEDGDVWMRALDARNKMSHTYSQKTFDVVVRDIAARYFPALQALQTTFLQKAVDEGFA